jgi:Ser/Thr protein kinase RdoA (MazF antagonist)
MVMERLHGVTMLQDLIEHPEHAGEHGRTLAELHRLLDRVPAMKPSNADERLLHLDVHPGNVMLTASGPVLFDWTNAAPGRRDLDVATTWLVLACMGMDEAATTDQVMMRAQLLGGFLDRIDTAKIRTVLPVAGAARLADPATTTVERVHITAFVRTGIASRAEEA